MTNTDLCCWWCCHPPVVLGMPTRYNKTKGSFETYGHFCSYECMKAYNLQDTDGNRCARSSLITLARQKNLGVFTPLKTAPPRQALKMFGGDLDIDDFRAETSEVVVTVLPMIPVSYVVEKQANFKWVKQTDAGDRLTDQKPIVTNPIRLKPASSGKLQNPLEKVLGVYPK